MDKFLSHTAALMLNARCQSIFLINNYDHMVSYLEVGTRGARGWEKRVGSTLTLFRFWSKVPGLYPCVAPIIYLRRHPHSCRAVV